MARGRKKKQYRKKFKGVNVVNAAEAYTLANVWTQAGMQVNPLQFFFDMQGAGNTAKITFWELLDSAMGGSGGVGSAGGGATAYNRGDRNAFDAVASNLRNNGVLPAVGKSIGIGLGFELGKKLTRRPRRIVNKFIKDFGLGDIIKV